MSDSGDPESPPRVKLPLVELDRGSCDRARRSRDARFDGRFFIGVITTGVYCRPICPARSAKDENVRYFPTAAAAQAAGFRPCLRCRPEAAPGTPAWHGTSGLVSRALRLISEGALDANGVDRLADRLGVTARHLRRLFRAHLGATPLEVALTRRVHFAKKLLDETTLPFDEVALASGFGSLRRFNGQIRETFARTPTQLRRLARRRVALDPERYTLRLAYRPPFDWDAMLEFLRLRAIPGVESVVESRYRRTIGIDGRCGVIEVSRLEARSELELEVRFADSRALLGIVERARQMFDLGADPAVIAFHLESDPLLREKLVKHPGIRVPGAWDAFETAVLAILGQRAAAGAAAATAGRIAAMFGSPVSAGEGLERMFPSPASLARAELERAGVSSSRAEAIRSLARQVADGTMSIRRSSLARLPGLTSWSAEYVAMRALGEPDAFPSGDKVVSGMAGGLTEAELDRRSEAWRPWRAYAVVLLWQAWSDGIATESWRRSYAQPEHDADRHRGRDRSPVVVAADGVR
jgi:AraC family transcriptional regulator of adaptative response / DNA-3-methyladenine glycosylase II